MQAADYRLCGLQSAAARERELREAKGRNTGPDLSSVVRTLTPAPIPHEADHRPVEELGIKPRHNARVNSVMTGGGVISDCQFMINENQTSSYLLCKDEQLTITRYSWVSLNTPGFSRC